MQPGPSDIHSNCSFNPQTPFSLPITVSSLLMSHTAALPLEPVSSLCWSFPLLAIQPWTFLYSRVTSARRHSPASGSPGFAGITCTITPSFSLQISLKAPPGQPMASFALPGTTQAVPAAPAHAEGNFFLQPVPEG